ncbi:TIGR04222 domain-containing membrane protein [Streptomyces sp. NPDC054854]
MAPCSSLSIALGAVQPVIPGPYTDVPGRCGADPERFASGCASSDPALNPARTRLARPPPGHLPHPARVRRGNGGRGWGWASTGGRVRAGRLRAGPAGGPHRVAEVALLRLRERGLVRVIGSRVRSEGPADAGSAPVERALTELCARGASLAIVLAEPARGPEVARIGQGLRAARLLGRVRPNRPTAAGRRLVAGPGGAARGPRTSSTDRPSCRTGCCAGPSRGRSPLPAGWARPWTARRTATTGRATARTAVTTAGTAATPAVGEAGAAATEGAGRRRRGWPV